MFPQCPCYQARPIAHCPCILAAYITVFASPYHFIEGLVPTHSLCLQCLGSLPCHESYSPHILVFMIHYHKKSCRKSLLRKKRTRTVPFLSICCLNYSKRRWKRKILQIYNFLSHRVLKKMVWINLTFD